MSLLGRLVLMVTGWGPVRRMFTSGRWGRRAAMRFVAGETLDEAVAVARDLNSRGFLVSLDLLGEHVTDAALASQSAEGYGVCLDRIQADGLEANISVKLTQLGLGLDGGLAERLLGELAVRAAAAGTTVTVDMEESALTGVTLDLYCRAQAEHGNLGLALQAALHRTPADLARVLPLGGHLRLCKGAYDEPAEVALRRREQVSAAYASLLAELMADEGVRPAVATHDGRLVARARELAGGRQQPFEFQMLYGIRPSLQAELVAAGFPVRVYVPYGAAWYPYLTRRLAERPANVWFFARAFFGR
ncbi:MAG TPA: proline dehydrogenase family protein [Acidimicrobiia bacterium]|nr:proline dehydrogenase family protein [Acidimicrobiia bacterium]